MNACRLHLYFILQNSTPLTSNVVVTNYILIVASLTVGYTIGIITWTKAGFICELRNTFTITT